MSLYVETYWMSTSYICHIKSSSIHCVRRGLLESPFTISWAVERLFPATNTTGPDMELSVLVKQRLWRVPSLPMLTAAQGASTSPFKVHRGGLPDFRFVSTWNSAGCGSITSIDFIFCTIEIACSAGTIEPHITKCAVWTFASWNRSILY